MIYQIFKVPNLHVMTAGKNPPNPALLLSSEAMNDLLNMLAMQYDKIIIDAPPAFHISDAPLLASKVNGIILIFKADKIRSLVLFYRIVAKRFLVTCIG